jgi:hypothetical protein
VPSHTEFWTLVGTTAPVLLVANVVAWGQANDVLLANGLAQKPAWRRTDSGFRPRTLVVALTALGVAVTLNLLTLLAAMLDLAGRSMPVAWGFAGVFAAILATLAYGGLYYSEIKIMRRHSPTPEGPAA